MTQTEPFIPINAQHSAEQSPVSPAVAEIMERTHAWALLELERFASRRENPFLCMLEEGNATIAYLLGKEANPADFSRIVRFQKQLRSQKAASDESFKKAA